MVLLVHIHDIVHKLTYTICSWTWTITLLRKCSHTYTHARLHVHIPLYIDPYIRTRIQKHEHQHTRPYSHISVRFPIVFLRCLEYIIFIIYKSKGHSLPNSYECASKKERNAEEQFTKEVYKKFTRDIDKTFATRYAICFEERKKTKKREKERKKVWKEKLVRVLVRIVLGSSPSHFIIISDRGVSLFVY